MNLPIPSSLLKISKASSISNRLKRTTKSSIPTDDVPIGRTLITVKGNPSHDPSIDDDDHTTNPPYPACDKLSASFPLDPRFMYRIQYHGSRTRLNEHGLEADIHAWHPRCAATQPDLRQLEDFRNTVHKSLADVREEGFYSPFVALFADENSADFWARSWKTMYKKEWERCWLFKIDTEKLDPDTTKFYSIWDMRNTMDVHQGDILSALIWQHKGEALVLHRVPNEAIVGIREVLTPMLPWYKKRLSWRKTKRFLKKITPVQYF